MAKNQGNSHYSSMRIKFMKVAQQRRQEYENKIKEDKEKNQLSSTQEQSSTKTSEDKSDKGSLKNQAEDKSKKPENTETKFKEVQKKPALLESEKNIETILKNENDKAKVIITESAKHLEMIAKNIEQISSQTNAITKNTEVIPKPQDVVDFRPESDKKIPEIKPVILNINKNNATEEIKDIQKIAAQPVSTDKNNAMPTDNKAVQTQIVEKIVPLAEIKVVPIINPQPIKLNEIDKKTENIVVENPRVILEPKKEIKPNVTSSKVEAKSIVEEKPIPSKIIPDKIPEISKITNIQPAQQSPVNKTLLSNITPNPINQNPHVDEVKKIGEIVTNDFHL